MPLNQEKDLVCVKSVQSVLTTATSLPSAAACATDAGFSLTSDGIVDAAMAKYMALAVCQMWYLTDVVGGMHQILRVPQWVGCQEYANDNDDVLSDFTTWVQSIAKAQAAGNRTAANASATSLATTTTTAPAATMAKSSVVMRQSRAATLVRF
ncbi:Aste57867_9911 [Aphanomyces stellatus]|uniref:Aste57867_9911 protein n=1 Tax=Aphanomyces stellatus TaxID=120398 RepID=A0A485KPD4_9STRA|nr:hypothetical protein As57867_009872 [Aphanomyces stellatus]VFT86790.1 Aste57867_9911 [Aphanomyces stellatus]